MDRFKKRGLPYSILLHPILELGHANSLPRSHHLEFFGPFKSVLFNLGNEIENQNYLLFEKKSK